MRRVEAWRSIAWISPKCSVPSGHSPASSHKNNLSARVSPARKWTSTSAGGNRVAGGALALRHERQQRVRQRLAEFGVKVARDLVGDVEGGHYAFPRMFAVLPSSASLASKAASAIAPSFSPEPS